ncbi:MAG: 3-hydroxyacyl-CoA dehydrogenase NAD-binding domain-containing protein [Microbacteriaceae bacterium]
MSKLSENVASLATVTTESTPAGKPILVVTLVAEDARRPAVLGPRGLDNLDAALDEVQSRLTEKIAAVVVRGSGRAFCAGADLDMMASVADRAVSLTIAEAGHRVLQRLATLGVPTVAEINGVALGGGLELALHCSYRIVAESVSAIGLPEISLGLIPGWGGATLLPRLIPFEKAVTVLLDNPVKNNQLLTSRKALELGVVDAVASDEHLHDDVLRFIDDGFPAQRSEFSVSDSDIATLRAKVESYSQRSANPATAMSRLLEVVEAGTTIGAGFSAEDDALADLIVTSEFRNRVYSFHLTTSRARKPAGVPDVEPREIRHIGVIGAGLMASQFATLFAEKLNVPVTLTDVSQERLDSAVTRIGDALKGRVERGSLTPERREQILSNLNTTLSKADFADCDFVMEAVFEDLDVKVNVLREVEQHVSPTCILATNTSSLSVTAMAESLDHPERLIGFHFFNPVAVMPLIEVVSTLHSDPVAIATAIACAGDLRKTPVIVKDLPGFVVNRILSVFLSDVFDEVAAGSSPASISHQLDPLRLPMDPFALVDLIGRAVTLHMIESLANYAPERVHVAAPLRESTDNPMSSSIASDIASSRADWSAAGADFHNRVCDSLVREIDIMLTDGVVADVKDIDLCMIVGAGWPVAHGGLSRYLDEIGSTERVLGHRFH